MYHITFLAEVVTHIYAAQSCTLFVNKTGASIPRQTLAIVGMFPVSLSMFFVPFFLIYSPFAVFS